MFSDGAFHFWPKVNEELLKPKLAFTFNNDAAAAAACRKYHLIIYSHLKNDLFLR